MAIATKTIFISPAARRFAQDNHIDIEKITGTGPNGRIILRDVQFSDVKDDIKPDASENNVTQERLSPDVTNLTYGKLPDARLFFDKNNYKEVPLSPGAKSIAKRLTQSTQQLPHYYVSVDCNISELERMRVHVNKALQERKTGEKLTLNDFIIRACAMGLHQHGDVNVSFCDDAILYHHHADISVAVALKDGGLVTPIIKKAETKSLREISIEVKHLVKRAGAFGLKPEEYEGGGLFYF